MHHKETFRVPFPALPRRTLSMLWWSLDSMLRVYDTTLKSSGSQGSPLQCSGPLELHPGALQELRPLEYFPRPQDFSPNAVLSIHLPFWEERREERRGGRRKEGGGRKGEKKIPYFEITNTFSFGFCQWINSFKLCNSLEHFCMYRPNYPNTNWKAGVSTPLTAIPFPHNVNLQTLK